MEELGFWMMVIFSVFVLWVFVMYIFLMIEYYIDNKKIKMMEKELYVLEETKKLL